MDNRVTTRNTERSRTRPARAGRRGSLAIGRLAATWDALPRGRATAPRFTVPAEQINAHFILGYN